MSNGMRQRVYIYIYIYSIGLFGVYHNSSCNNHLS